MSNGSDIVIVGIGSVTPLGMNLAESAANIRAGVSSYAECSIMDKIFEPFVVSVVPAENLEPLNDELKKEKQLTYREMRILRLAAPALREAASVIKSDLDKVPLYLGLPEMATTIPLSPNDLIRRLAIQSGCKFAVNQSKGLMAGRAAGLNALHLAIEAVKAGAPIVLAGGADSYFDPYILATLDMEKRINSEQHMDGFTPGEGATILALASVQTAQSKGLRPLGRIAASATGQESGHLYSDQPYKGEGLAATIQSALAQVPDKSVTIKTVFSSMNGENHFAKEWGVAYLRSKDRFAEEHLFEHPADCIGDTGAASGPTLVGCAIDAIGSGAMNGPALVYASSDRAPRGACVVTGA